MKVKYFWILVIIVIAFIVIVNPHEDTLNGKYYHANTHYITFKRDGTCIWHQDELFFKGTYEKEDDTFLIFIEGSGLYPSQTFKATPTSNNGLYIQGGEFKEAVFFLKQ
mgnify:CR=1 FL=1